MAEFIPKPEALVKFQRNIKNGETCAGVAIKYDNQLECLFVYLGNGTIGVMPKDEVSIYQYTYPMGDNSLVPYQISTIVGKKINVKIIGIVDGIYMLSRKEEMMKAYDYFVSHEEKNIIARIVNIIDKGMFCDIGGGITGFLPISEISHCYVSNIRSHFSVGNIICVKIIDIKPSEDNYKISLSRRMAYSDITTSNIIKEGDILIGTICYPIYEGDGYFVELTPAISGIVDIPPDLFDLEEGTCVSVYVKKITEKGIKLNLVKVLAKKMPGC